MDYSTTLTLIISLAVFISSVVSPIIVQYVSNRHQDKKAKTLFIEHHRHEVVEKYLKELGAFISNNCNSSKSSYHSSVAEIYMYAPSELWDKISEIHELALTVEKMPPSDEKDEAVLTMKKYYHNLCKDFSIFSRDKKSNRKKKHAQRPAHN